jgi:hypothetical protein
MAVEEFAHAHQGPLIVGQDPSNAGAVVLGVAHFARKDRA